MNYQMNVWGLSLLISFFPVVVNAQGVVAGPLGITLVQVFAVVNVLIPIMLALAVLMFLWGLVKFIAHAGEEGAVASGVRHMIWGMIALFVMVGFWGIIGYVQQSLGLTSGGISLSPPPLLNVLP